MTAQDIRNLVDAGIKEFGTHSYFDKGPDEVMDTNAIVEHLNQLPVEQTKAILIELLDDDTEDERYKTLLSFMLMDMQTIPQDRWDELMDSKLEEVF